MRHMTEQEWHAFVMEGTRTGKVATARKDGRLHVVPVCNAAAGELLVRLRPEHVLAQAELAD